jgi:hypothetical protein
VLVLKNEIDPVGHNPTQPPLTSRGGVHDGPAGAVFPPLGLRGGQGALLEKKVFQKLGEL